MAVEDMYSWIENFKSTRTLERYDDDTEEIVEIYWNYIEKMKEKIFKEL
jgi:hypothetical protein